MIAKLFLIVIFAPFVGALASYIAGRIVLPDMGLTPPNYWAWFWAIMAAAFVKAAYAILAELLVSNDR